MTKQHEMRKTADDENKMFCLENVIRAKLFETKIMIDHTL